MSNTQFAFISRAKVPSQAALQASIDALGFNLKVDPELRLLTDSGFSPCVLNGISDVGFELLSGPTSDLFVEAPHFAGLSQGLDFCIQMIWHGSFKDCAAAMIVACALATDFGALVSYEGNPPDSAQDILKEIPAALKEALRES